MFTRDALDLSELDCSIKAADTAFQIFSNWKKQRQDRATLQLRVSIHQGYPVYTHKDPCYWASEDLNAFSKYERKIALSGTIAITDKIYRNLSGNLQKRFPINTKRELLIGGRPDIRALIKHVYYDATRPPPTYPGINSLATFLHKLSTKHGLVSDGRVGPASAIQAVFGDAILLYGVRSPSESLLVEFKKCDPPSSYMLTEKELKAVRAKAKVLKRESLKRGFEDKKKVSPQRIVFPLTDFPCLTIEWHPERWSIARAFQSVLEENQSDNSLWFKLAQYAADAQAKGMKYPGILCVHILIRTVSTGNDKKFVLLCQRNERGPEGFFHEGKWSCSMEEQVNPGEKIENCVLRGISEELLGPQTSAYFDVKTVAVFLERVLLNLTLLAVVDIPLSFEEVEERWRRDSIDKSEHRQLVALPLEKKYCFQMSQVKIFRSECEEYLPLFRQVNI